MKLIMVLATDADVFITQVAVDTPDNELYLNPVEFSFRNCIANKAIESLLASAKVERAINKKKAGYSAERFGAS